MTISNLTSTHLKTLITLVEKKEQLAEEIQIINAKLNAFALEDGGSVSTGLQAPARRARGKRGGRPKGSKNKATAVNLPKGRPAKAPVGKGKSRGSVKEAVIATLKASGKPGIHIDDLAKKVGSTKNSLNVWLYTNRKKNKALKKLDKPGTWGWEG